MVTITARLCIHGRNGNRTGKFAKEYTSYYLPILPPKIKRFPAITGFARESLAKWQYVHITYCYLAAYKTRIILNFSLKSYQLKKKIHFYTDKQTTVYDELEVDTVILLSTLKMHYRTLFCVEN